MLSDDRLEKIKEFLCPAIIYDDDDPWFAILELLSEITALRKIAEAANDVGYSWSLANYPHPTVAKPMYILNEALKEWRGGSDD